MVAGGDINIYFCHRGVLIEILADFRIPERKDFFCLKVLFRWARGGVETPVSLVRGQLKIGSYMELKSVEGFREWKDNSHLKEKLLLIWKMFIIWIRDF